MYYLDIANNKIIGIDMMGYQEKGISYPITHIEVTEEIYNNYLAEDFRYIYQDGEIVENPDYEEIKKREERQRLDTLTLTPADVERALYKAKQMDFDDLKALIVQALPTVDIKALSIEFRAKDFYRGAEANGMRLFDVVGALLGYSPADMDYLFENKELPEKEEPETETEEE